MGACPSTCTDVRKQTDHPTRSRWCHRLRAPVAMCPRMVRGWLWLLVPTLAIVELGAHLVFANRAPEPDAWHRIRAPIARLRQPEDALVVAPRWAEPLARHALGDRLWPIADAARPGFEGAARALVV